LNLIGSGNASIQNAPVTTAFTLTNDVNHTIAGFGNVGGFGLNLINNGTVNANGGAPLNLSGGGTITNNGTLKATNFGTLNIANNVTGGLILADGGTVNIGSSGGSTIAITGSTLTSQDGGTLGTVLNGSALLDGVTLTGNSTYSNGAGSLLQLQNNMVNEGTIASNSTVILKGNTFLTGGGTVNLSSGGGSAVAQILPATNGLTLTNANNTIQGAGNIGNSTPFSVINGGTIDANISGQALVLQGGSYTNSYLDFAGTLKATNGGILAVNGATINNGATVNNPNGWQIDTTAGLGVFSGGSIQGGTLKGNFETPAASNFLLDGSTSGKLTLATGSIYNVGDGGSLHVQGSIGIGSNAAIDINAGSSDTFLALDSSTTLSGQGTIHLSSSGTGTARIDGVSQLLTLANQGIIDGAGVIGKSQILYLNNLGTVNANTSGQTLTLARLTSVQNAGGVLEATNRGTLAIDGRERGNGSTDRERLHRGRDFERKPGDPR
jgi:fibronectin-binding autotransporter adhesin